jgi:hypothetical protein
MLSFLWMITLSEVSHAENKKLRLLGGGGHTSVGGDFPDLNPVNYHFALQGLLYIKDDASSRAYGFEVGHHRAFKYSAGASEYISVGLIVERLFWGFLVGQIGTVGYIGIGNNDGNPFGLRASPGLEYAVGKNTTFSLFFRQDFIFDDEFIYARSLELGVGFKF